ncbi:class V aminotransferase [Listeria weihenstephanensis FSL R9-0317]|uniref:Cysteine desulfurase n=1 Tax=Listeria weihenstephanensis TaxID=1006155 RepID=A0A1S7FV72_9LIST|nr:cysteine desulfurase family protein [Listeria weihenstephanensis]AQY51346.1 cysteine desulfurase [Listeria weihenstephanensis]EUJ37145.1 class V aminotransferase [Listeria weihenstephanensis FSL R9-0317]
MIYFDNSATTKPLDACVETYTKVATNYFANPSSLHRYGAKVSDLHEQARTLVAGMLSVSPEEVIFTSGGTESNNMAIKGIAGFYSNRGKHIITTAIEHPSVQNTMRYLETQGFEVTRLPVDASGVISVADLKNALREDTILVSVMHVNNEVGSVQPIAEIATLLEDREQTFFHVDHVQGLTKVALDMAGIDLVSVSGHKVHGLKGTGVLIKKKRVSLTPLLDGGGQEFGLRNGTENTAGVVAFAKALRIGLEDQKAHFTDLETIRDYLLTALADIPEVSIHTDKKKAAPHICCFSVIGHRGEILVHALEEYEMYVSTTSACSSRAKLASSTLKAMKVTDEEAVGAVRVSLSYQNTMAEAQRFIEVIQVIIKNLNEVVK